MSGGVLLGGCLMLIDTLWGALAVLGIGFEPLLDIPLDISLVAGLPAFALDAWSRSRVIVFLPALYLFRWWVVSHIGPTPQHLSLPWRGSVLLIVAAALLQWSKLQKSRDGSARS
jgi:hypothetical protein